MTENEQGVLIALVYLTMFGAIGNWPRVLKAGLLGAGFIVLANVYIAAFR